MFGTFFKCSTQSSSGVGSSVKIHPIAEPKPVTTQTQVIGASHVKITIAPTVIPTIAAKDTTFPSASPKKAATLALDSKESLKIPTYNKGKNKTANAICGILEEKLIRTDKLPSDPNSITAYHSISVPSLPITNYFAGRLIEHIYKISDESMIIMLALVNIVTREQIFPFSSRAKKIIQQNKENKRIREEKEAKEDNEHKEDKAKNEKNVKREDIVEFNSLTAHRLILTCLLVAHKMTDESTLNNAAFANVGGVAIKEMNALERELLHDLDYNVPFQAIFYDDALRASSLIPDDTIPELRDKYIQFVELNNLHEEDDDDKPISRFNVFHF